MNNAGPVGTGSPATAAPGFSLTSPPVQSVAPAPARPPLADIAALVRTLPTDERSRSAPAPARPSTTQPRSAQAQPAGQTGRNTRTDANAAGTRNARAEANAAGTRGARSRAPAPPAHPARSWVQIAGGANRAALPREFARLRALAPQLLGRRDAYTTPLRATNRLLVGPFRNEAEALAFVNQLRRADIPAFAWTSDAGQEIERLQTSR
jgi:hypothetical protein